MQAIVQPLRCQARKSRWVLVCPDLSKAAKVRLHVAPRAAATMLGRKVRRAAARKAARPNWTGSTEKTASNLAT